MHKNTEFVLIVALAAISIAAVAYFVFYITFGPAAATNTPTGAVVGSSDTGGWFMPFLAGFVLLVICATTIYHFWHHKGKGE